MKRSVYIIFIAALLMMAVAPVAVADNPPPVGSCPKSFEIFYYVGGPVTPEEDAFTQKIDRNEDGYLCYKEVRGKGNCGQVKEPETVFNCTFIDNSLPLGK